MKTKIEKYILDNFKYEDGSLIRFRQINRHSPGKVGSHGSTSGYLTVKILGETCLVHRVIFFLCNGYWPRYVDHINRDKLDNRIENLRDATRSQNHHNSSVRCDSSTGVKGVSWSKISKKYVTRVQINKVRVNLGYFHDLELAGLVSSEAVDKYRSGCQDAAYFRF